MPDDPKVTDEMLKQFDEQGYLVIPRGVPYEALESARAAARRMISKCTNGGYPYCRADARLSERFIEKVDHIFHPDIFEPAVFEAIQDSRILETAKLLLKCDDVFINMNRMHTTQGYSAWSAWHRDDPADSRDYTIKASLPLYNECGFYLVPGSHKSGDKSIDGENTSFKGHLPGEVCVPVRAGDLLFFHTGIAHRGSCAGRKKYRRAHVHFRVTRMDKSDEHGWQSGDWYDRPELLSLSNNTWREILTKKPNTEKRYKAMSRGSSKTGLRNAIERLKRQVFYYSTAVLPQDHPIVVTPPNGFVPYVRVPKEYESMYSGR